MAKKIVRLTESDLTRLIRKILKEEEEDGTWPDQSVLRPLVGKTIRNTVNNELYRIKSISTDTYRVFLEVHKISDTGKVLDVNFGSLKYDCKTKTEKFDLLGDVPMRDYVRNQAAAEQIKSLYCSKFKPTPKINVDFKASAGQAPSSNV